MEYLYIFFIIFGLMLVIVEIIFIPGTTVVGVLGLISLIYGIYLTFQSFGIYYGGIATAISLIICVLLLVFAFNNKTWELFSLKNINKFKVNEEISYSFAVGTEGTTISTLRPSGKAIIDEKIIEVTSNGQLIETNKKIRIIKIIDQKIIVEQIN